MIRAAKRPAILPDKRREAAPKRSDKPSVRRFYLNMIFAVPVDELKKNNRVWPVRAESLSGRAGWQCFHFSFFHDCFDSGDEKYVFRMVWR